MNRIIQLSLADRVYEALIEGLCDGRLAPGERIFQEEIAKQFGVSRQPIQQVLMLLKKQGFLIEVGRQGLTVAPIEPDFVKHMYQVRALIDGLACREAAAHFDRRKYEKGLTLIRAGVDAIRSASISKLIAADMNFHRFMYDSSRNPIIPELMLPYWQHIRRIIGFVLQDTSAQLPFWEQHEAILTSVAAHDSKTAEELAKAHCENAAERLIDRLRESPLKSLVKNG